MTLKHDTESRGRQTPPLQHAMARSQSIDWYAEGEERIVDVQGIRIMVRFVGRKGRRGRIVITAPPGTTFMSGVETQASHHPVKLR